MSKAHRNALLCWLALLVLGAAEFGGSFVHLSRSWRPVLLLPALGMVALVGLQFMRVRDGITLVRCFALAGLLWLTLLLGLGTMDPMTRATYVVQGTEVPQ
jgi:caa(3)-type oxidase subunit IV